MDNNPVRCEAKTEKPIDFQYKSGNCNPFWTKCSDKKIGN